MEVSDALCHLKNKGAGKTAKKGALKKMRKNLRASAMKLVAGLVESRLNADQTDASEDCLPCDCGGKARSAGRQFHIAGGAANGGFECSADEF